MSTLVEQLKDAEHPAMGYSRYSVRESHGIGDLSIPFVKSTVTERKSKIVRDFLEKDDIASQVARQGYCHYSDLAKSVADRYSGFWGKTSDPKLDTEFDLRLEEPIHSMNSVGAVPPIDSLQFMTSRRALDLKGSYKSGIIGSGLIVLVTAGIYYLGVKEAKDFSPYVPLAFIMGIPLLGHLGARFFQYFSMSKNISNLETAASTTEKYLEELI